MNKELTIFLLIIWIAFCLINLMEGIYQDIKENNIKLNCTISKLIQEVLEFCAPVYKQHNIKYYPLYQVSNSTSKPNTFVVLASVEEGLPNIHCYIAKELLANKGLNAGTVIRELGKYIDGNGGGQPFFASGKGKNSSGIAEALANASTFIK